MIKKINCILIILVLLLNVLFPTIANAIDNEDVIYINTGEDLWKIAEMVNNGDSFSGKIIELTKDIDLNCSKSKQWVPIGNHQHSFYGTFNGNNHKISGMEIYDWDFTSDIGLFGNVSVGSIRNLIVTDSVLNLEHKDAYDDHVGYTIGGIVGYLGVGNLINCQSNTKIIAEDSGSVGGIVGHNGSGNIIKCSYSGTIETTLNGGSRSEE